MIGSEAFTLCQDEVLRAAFRKVGVSEEQEATNICKPILLG